MSTRELASFTHTNPKRQRGFSIMPRLRFGLMWTFLFSLCPQVESAAPLVWAADADGGAPYVFRDPEHTKNTIGL